MFVANRLELEASLAEACKHDAYTSSADALFGFMGFLTNSSDYPRLEALNPKPSKPWISTSEPPLYPEPCILQ